MATKHKAAALPARFTKIADAAGVHIITADALTALEWQAGYFPDRYTPAEAEKVAKKCRLGGHKDWRVPGPADFATIVDHSRFNPAIDTDLFPGTPSEAFLASGVPYAPRPSESAWVQDFYCGLSSIGGRDSRYRLRLVRGPSRQFSAFLPSVEG